VAEKRVLYLAASLLTAYRVRRGRIAVDARFSENEEGLAAFDAYLKRLPKGTLAQVLADVVEEDFQHETIPYLRGSERRAVIDRRLAQRYRDPSLSLVQSLGIEKGQRRDERLLVSSFTNPAMFQPWLAVLRSSGLAVVGVFSVEQVAPHLARTLGYGKAPVLVVSLNAAGLRQSYVEPRRLRFSRLSPLPATDLAAPERLAVAFLRETSRLRQYLVSARSLAQENEVLEVLMVAPPELRPGLEAVRSDEQLSIHVVDLPEAMKRVGLRERPEDAGAEVLYVYLAATATPREQYAREALRGRYRVHQIRTGILAAGALACGGSLIAAGTDVLSTFGVRNAIEQDERQLKVIADQYARLAARLPPMPTTAESVRVAVDQHAALEKATLRPDRALASVSQALQASPRIELDTLRWERVDTLPASAAGAPGVQKLAGPGPFELVELSGRVPTARASEYRSITALVNELIDGLKRQPEVEVVASRLPFDVGSQTSLSGDIGTERNEVPGFSVTIARKATP
jgi:hypothetical protein